MKFFDIVLDAVFPRTKIERKLDDITANELFLSARKTTHDDRSVITVFDYDSELIRQAIWSLKFRNRKRLAEVFAQILYDELLESMADMKIFHNFENPILIPVPMSKKKQMKRGYNQCELIAQEMVKLDRNSSFQYLNKILIKVKDTPPQSRTKNKKERLENLRGCFAVRNPEKIRRKNIILLDDITTTGATLKEAKKTLRKHGVKKIVCLTVAH